MYRSILILFLVGLLTCLCASQTLAQTAPSQPVQGSIKSVAADKSSFVVTVKKADVTVLVTADTKYALDDSPSDFAKAITAGQDVNVILNANGKAFVVLSTTVPPASKGTVKSFAADNTSFILTPKTGADVTVKVNAATKYTLDKAASTLPLALAAGNTATVALGADGVATDVTAKSAKAPKAPATAPAVPALP